jgi:fumarate reductase subunit D
MIFYGGERLMAHTSWTLKRKNDPRIRIMAFCSYMTILCLVPLMFNRDHDEYVNFHARQGLVLWIWGVIAIFSLYIPVVGSFFFSFSVLVISGFALAGAVSVILGRAWKLPVVSMVASIML